MARSLPAPMVTALTSDAVSPCFLLDLQLTSGTLHVWSGVGTVEVNGNVYTGVGSLGGVGDVTEGLAVQAAGTSVMLTGIDPTLLNDCLTDIQVNAPATLWLGIVSAGVITATVQLFQGIVGAPAVAAGPKTMAIQIKIETRMSNLHRASNRRYTTADQRYYYPSDIGFAWVEVLNDIALQWG